MAPHDEVQATVAEAADLLVDLSHRIHAHPELALEEERACAWVADTLEAAGLDVTRGAYDLATAFTATAGSAGPHIIVCAEYDALPGIGHACGHNVIAAAGAGAGLALAPLAERLGFRVTVIGTPAEEAFGAKALLVERGAFDGAAAAMMVHPGPHDIAAPPMLALRDLLVTVHGRAAHAALAPGRGNALTALTDVHHLLAHRTYGDWERCAGVILDGGAVPNVVPETAVAHYLVRARTADDLVAFGETIRGEIVEAVEATGCTADFDSVYHPYREMRHDAALVERYVADVTAAGRELVPPLLVGAESAASTDMGTVSQVVPAIHPSIGIDSGPAWPHQRGFAAAAAAPGADLAIVDGAVAMARTALDLVLDPGLLAAVSAGGGVGGEPALPRTAASALGRQPLTQREGAGDARAES